MRTCSAIGCRGYRVGLRSAGGSGAARLGEAEAAGLEQVVRLQRRGGEGELVLAVAEDVHRDEVSRRAHLLIGERHLVGAEGDLRRTAVAAGEDIAALV